MFAIIDSGGKQYLVQKGSIVKVDRLQLEQGMQIDIQTSIILFHAAPSSFLSCATVQAEVIEQCRGKKIYIFKKKRRKNFRRKVGYRSAITVLRINDIKVYGELREAHGN
ncbi:50S ribosomal protein L21 [Wolbachia endosymbiont of Howardula sp.]|uniref:50S ribosomal protein L21 n=1 Tax=Wolbachia endosymbiont of Howardula sp. TaxID=2916816 RepID=UPI00217DE403|nr:50S ribosomal protein L21 [Wolbachia endosymbiont of Howardula sp.]UWI83181.1 50S ribosomal protein L21 [Wolbachia endosymbiont of Howardula sp.]